MSYQDSPRFVQNGLEPRWGYSRIKKHTRRAIGIQLVFKTNRNQDQDTSRHIQDELGSRPGFQDSSGCIQDELELRPVYFKVHLRRATGTPQDAF